MDKLKRGIAQNDKMESDILIAKLLLRQIRLEALYVRNYPYCKREGI